MASSRIKRHLRIRKKIAGTAEVPRVAVYRSAKHMQVQLVDDESGKTLLGMGTSALKSSKSTKSEKAKELGKKFAEAVLKLGKNKEAKVVFDRGGYRYHGRVKAFAESLRENGLKF